MYDLLGNSSRSSCRAMLAQSPRKVLFINSFILAICFFSISGFSLLICWLFYTSASASTSSSSNTNDTIFVNWLLAGIIGIMMTIICILGMRGAHLVSFELLLIYFWGITMLIGPLTLAAAAGFNFYFYVTVWIRHYWEAASFASIRKYFCPLGTANGACAVPINGYPYCTQEKWCQANNYTDCGTIRESAVVDALDVSKNLLLYQAIMGIFNVSQIILSMYICTKILTASVITQSMNDTINYLLILPIGATFGLGAYTYWMSNYEIDTSWIPLAFLCLGGAMLIQVPLGVAAGRLKSRYLLSGSIILLTLIILGLVVTGVGCILYALLWSGRLSTIPSDTLQTIACEQNLASCCCCDGRFQGDDDVFLSNTTLLCPIYVTGTKLCPEWSDADVLNYVLVTLKISGIVAFICTLYFFGAIIVAEILRQNLANYKSDYI